MSTDSSADDGPNVYFIFPTSTTLTSKLTSDMDTMKILQNNTGTRESIEAKLKLLKQLLFRISNGEQFPKFFMSLISCLTNDDKDIKKIAMQIFELVNYYDETTGKLLPEAILICNALKTNLEHPNEYIRAAALRLVSKYKDLEVLDPIMPAVLANLEHHHQIVRRHALACVLSFVHIPELSEYLNHLGERIYRILTTEVNNTCRHFALQILMVIDQELAIDYFLTISNTLHIHHDALICAVLILIQNTYTSTTRPKIRKLYIQALMTFLSKVQQQQTSANSGSSSSSSNTAGSSAISNTITPTTIYYTAKLLLQLTVMQSAIKLAIRVFIFLLRTSSNLCIKQLLMDDLSMFCTQRVYANVLSPYITDLLSVLPVCTDNLRNQILELAVLLSTNANVDNIISLLKCEYFSLHCNQIPTFNDLSSATAAATGVGGDDSSVQMTTHKLEQHLLSTRTTFYNAPNTYQQRSVNPFQPVSLSDTDITFRKDLLFNNNNNTTTTTVTNSNNNTTRAIHQYSLTLFTALERIGHLYPRVIPTTLASVLLITILDNNNPVLALAALRSVKDIMSTTKDLSLRVYFVEKFLDYLPTIQHPEILRGMLYIIGEYTGQELISTNNNNNNNSINKNTQNLADDGMFDVDRNNNNNNNTNIGGNNNNNNNEQQVLLLQYAASSLITMIGLESFVPQQQLHEYQQRLAKKKNVLQNNNNNNNNNNNGDDENELNQLDSSYYTTNESFVRCLIYNNDMLFTTTIIIALTKLILKSYHFFNHIQKNVTKNNNNQKNNINQQQYQQHKKLHAQTLLIITRLLKFIPMMNVIDTTHVTNTPTAPMTMHTLAFNNFQNNNNTHNTGESSSLTTPTTNKVQDYYNLLTLEDPIWYNIPEMVSLGGLSSDARERLTLAFNILYKPEEFGYTISPITGKRELIFFASTQRMLANNVDSLLLGHHKDKDKDNKDNNNNNNNNNNSTTNNKNKNKNGINNNGNTTQQDFLPSIYYNHIQQQQEELDHDSMNNNDISVQNNNNNIILPDFPSLFGKTLGIDNILQTRDVTLPVQPFTDLSNSNTTSALGQPPDLRVFFDSMNTNNGGGGENDDFITPFAANPQQYGMLGCSIPQDNKDNNQDDASFGFDQQDNIISTTNNTTTNTIVKKIHQQLTGQSDLIYCEALLSIHMYDVTLDITLLNQTNTILQNVTFEIQTSPDLTMISHPPTFTLTARPNQEDQPSIDQSSADKDNNNNDDSKEVVVEKEKETWKAKTTLRFKVNSTETGVIFGCLSCDVNPSSSSSLTTTTSSSSAHQVKRIIYLQPMTIYISQYLHPTTCQPADYRSMWTEFEWENKVLISTNFTDPIEFVQHIIKLTNMQCLISLKPFILTTQQLNSNNNLKYDDQQQQQQQQGLYIDNYNNDTLSATSSSSSSAVAALHSNSSSYDNNQRITPPFISTNLYAISSFGEQALVNISVECHPTTRRLTGYMRVRAKTHGVARSLGDLMKSGQKKDASSTI